MKRLAILGLGHIGKYVYETLQQDKNFDVAGYDISTGHDLQDIALLESIIKNVDGVLASTPFHLNRSIASTCNKFNVDYFDLTESVEVTNYVKTLTGARFVTQCGLAPGMVSIIANDLANQLEVVKDIKIRVGALSTNATNHLQYYRSWNTEGLINEYIHPCPAIVNGRFCELSPLQDHEMVTIGGITLEAANTSGGLGSLAESFVGRANNVNYKTLRYPGHWGHIRFLAEDLGLKDNFHTYVSLFNKYIPKCTNDRVYILIEVTGTSNGVYKIHQYAKIIEATGTDTAIQISTGNGVLSILDVWQQDMLSNNTGWIAQENISAQAIYSSKYCLPYKI